MKIWKPGDAIAWRGISNGRPWHAHSAIVVSDTPEEMVNVLLPGSESFMEPSYIKGKKSARRRWSFSKNDWELVRYEWHTNRVLAITEPERYYSIMLFWNESRNEFVGYYVNFQLPFVRSHCGIDSLDLDLDIDINPDLSFVWKDEDDYQTSIAQGAIIPEWIAGIELAKPEILDRIENRKYPFDGSWLDWMPNSEWSPPKLPEGWDKV
ncbi:MAG: hypothetical protein MHPDNHAH_03455 [Anaerolineales bacterium]|nr:hypothetical protein [Anaerolineales bacterium]